MEKIVFAGTWQEDFRRQGLRTFGDFFHGLQGRFVNRNTKRDVMRLTLDGSGSRVLFMKRFHRPHVKDALAGLRQFGRPTSQAALEWSNANYLLRNGIGTYRPVCYGEQVTLGFERRSFLITEALDDLPARFRHGPVGRARPVCTGVDRGGDGPTGRQSAQSERITAGLSRLAHLCRSGRSSRWTKVQRDRPASDEAECRACPRRSGTSPGFNGACLHVISMTVSGICSYRLYAAGAGLDADALANAVTQRVRKLDKRRSPDRYYRRTTLESA